MDRLFVMTLTSLTVKVHAYIPLTHYTCTNTMTIMLLYEFKDRFSTRNTCCIIPQKENV